MSLYGSSVEYGLHCILSLVGPAEGEPPSSREMAEFQGISPSYVAKLFTKLAQAGLVRSGEGIRGGYRLARDPAGISVWDVVHALEGDKSLFECREIRRDCVLFAGDPPKWATRGLCPIHSVMRQAEARMREELKAVTLADLAGQVSQSAPKAFLEERLAWFAKRQSTRRDTK